MDSVNYPNFVDDQGGKSLLSKGALPQQTIMRYDVDLLTSNWHDIELKHKGNGLRIIFNYYHNIQDLSYLATLFFSSLHLISSQSHLILTQSYKISWMLLIRN